MNLNTADPHKAAEQALANANLGLGHLLQGLAGRATLISRLALRFDPALTASRDPASLVLLSPRQPIPAALP